MRLFLSALLLAALPAYASRTVTDMAGRTVTLPDSVRRVATLGPVPVLNSFVFAFRDSRLLVNGLPPNFAQPRWQYQYVFAPEIRNLPVIQGSGNDPIAANVLAAQPDVVLTMLPSVVHQMDAIHVPVVYLDWQKPEEVKQIMDLLGQVLGQPASASAYRREFDDTLRRVQSTLQAHSGAARPRVLYCDLARLTQPHLIAEWWIHEAGGQSVTDDGRTAQSLSFTLEQMLVWNPEVLIVTDARQVAMAYADPRLASLPAIRNHRVYVAPCGAHLWTNRTVEEPLTLLWAAKTLHPELFGSLNMESETTRFYHDFFGVSLTTGQARDVLGEVR